jgi:hypothetical protein
MNVLRKKGISGKGGTESSIVFVKLHAIPRLSHKEEPLCAEVLGIANRNPIQPVILAQVRFRLQNP